MLVITGEHDYETGPFFQLFRDNAAITVAAAEHGPDSATAWEGDDLVTFCTVVLYDMPRSITPTQQRNMRSLFERGC